MTEEQIKQKAENYAEVPFASKSDKDLMSMAFIDGYHECQKEHEWHYVKNKGTPIHEGHYLVCLRNKDRDILDCWISFDKAIGWYSLQVRLVDIYAWQEITPPNIKEK